MNWDDRIQQAALTDIGMRRANNQDSHAVVLSNDMEAWKKRGHFFMVADGMGAHAAGELASKLAVDGVQHLYHKYTDLSPPEALQKAILETNGEVHRRGQANSDFHNMGTTASTLVLLPQGALIAHIGDSRVYRVRADRLQQLTKDHSLVWELREQLPDDGELAIPKNVITRSLGPNPSVQADIEGPLPIEVADTFLLCSDGLTGRVTDEELAPILKHIPPGEAGHLLVDLANLRGGPDNITVIVVKVVGKDLASATNGSEPLRVGGSKSSATVQPAIWVCLGVCLLGALVLWVTDKSLPALMAGFGALVALLVGLVSHQRGKKTGGVSLNEGRRLGGGPYTDTLCAPPGQSVALLRDITTELRTAPLNKNWTIDWSPFDKHCGTGRASEEAGQHVQAMRSYAQAIRHLMSEVRAAQDRDASDSSIDY
ncbi:MAG: PP2C family serine/threonine-protein phosphatase [Pirellulaceae bacterium]